MTMAMRKSNQPRSVGRILSGQAHLSVLRLTEAWPDIVGPAAAGHCRPASFAKGRLVVSADSSAWANELDFLAAEIMPRLEALLGIGVVREIKFKTASRRRGLQAPSRAEEPVRPPAREPGTGGNGPNPGRDRGHKGPGVAGSDPQTAPKSGPSPSAFISADQSGPVSPA